jgi:hypothetical protein
MAEILSKHRQTNPFQVVHFAHAKRFDEAQRKISNCGTTPAMAASSSPGER